MTDQQILQLVATRLLQGKNNLDFILKMKEALHKKSPLKHMPVDYVRWVPIDKVQCNDYNPNSVAKVELNLLQLSILNDGYTQPVVTFYDAEEDKYIIVDGFHRYFCCRSNPEINKRTGGRVPVVVIEKSLADRMASTVRHNRARGKHSVDGMSDLVFKMLQEGMSDEVICNQLGMEVEELVKLKHITGFSKLFEGVEYNPAWETERQIEIKQAYLEGNGLKAKLKKKEDSKGVKAAAKKGGIKIVTREKK